MGAGEIMLQIVGQLLLTIFASIGIGAMCGRYTITQLLFAPSASKILDFWFRTKSPK
jgi:hypothetical protein